MTPPSTNSTHTDTAPILHLKPVAVPTGKALGYADARPEAMKPVKRPKMAGVDADALNRQKLIAGWNQPALTHARVMVVGAGALGNEMVKLLCQKGVGKIVLVDFDTIVPANLNRCVFFGPSNVGQKKALVIQRRARAQFPATEIQVWDEKVEEIPEHKFGEFDGVLGCLDNLGARVHLNANAYGKVPYIDGGTTGFMGKVQVVHSPGPCVECGMGKKDYDILWKKYSCVGDLLDWVDPKMPALASTTSIVAAVMANELVKLLHAKAKTPIPTPENSLHASLEGKLWWFDGRTTDSTTFTLSKRKECPVHG